MKEVSSSVAPKWVDGLNGQDCRPRLHTDVATFLLDTGSMASVVRPDPGDKIDHSIGLKTVDGSPFPCYGTKKVSFKIGRKTYQVEAVKALVKSPLLGWDFFKKYRLDTIWGEFGDLYLRDKRANIAKRLQHVVMPHESVPRFAKVDFKLTSSVVESRIFAAKCANHNGPVGYCI